MTFVKFKPKSGENIIFIKCFNSKTKFLPAPTHGPPYYNRYIHIVG